MNFHFKNLSPNKKTLKKQTKINKKKDIKKTSNDGIAGNGSLKWF